MALSRDRDDMLDETLGDRLSVEEFKRARAEAERMYEEDEATIDFNQRWGDVLRESEIEGMKQFIRQTRRRQPLPADVLPENDEYAMAVVLLVKLGFLRVADFLKTCTTTPADFDWADVEEALNKL